MIVIQPTIDQYTTNSWPIRDWDVTDTLTSSRSIVSGQLVDVSTDFQLSIHDYRQRYRPAYQIRLTKVNTIPILFVSHLCRTALTYCYCFYSATPSIKYGSRNNSGEIVFSFNPSGVDPQEIFQQHIPASHLSVQCASHKEALLNTYKYMFQKQVDKAAGMSYYPLTQTY